MIPAMIQHCLVCDQSVPAFLDGPSGRPNARCPHCQSLERHRFFALVMKDYHPRFESVEAILDIAPQSMIRTLLRQLTATYVGLDLSTQLSPSVRASITDLPLAANSVDVALCMHVLEHVPDDHRAMREIARVLTATGLVFIQVPRNKYALTDEDPFASEEERITRFGQRDHVRFYGTNLERRLRLNGLIPAVVWPAMLLNDAEIDRYGLVATEELWICSSASLRFRTLQIENRPHRRASHYHPPL